MMEPSSSPAAAASLSTPPPPTKAQDDLPALFSQMEEAVAALEPSPHSSPERLRDLRDQQDRHDSDDDMEQEEERLLDSSEKLRTLMMMRRGEGQGYDERQAKSSSLGPDAEVPRQLVFETVGASPSSVRPASALDIDVPPSSSSPSSPSSSPGFATPLRDGATTTAPSSFLSPTRDATVSTSSSTPAQLQYWDCNNPGAGTPTSPTRTAGFRTPGAMNTPGGGSIKEEEEEEEGNRVLCRTSSAFALPLAGEVEAELLGDVLVEEGKGADGNSNSSSSSSSSEGIASTDAFSSTATAITNSLAAVIGSLPPAPSTKPRSAWGEEDKDMHEIGCASRCLSEVSIQQRFCGLRGVASGGEDNDKSSSSSSSNAASASSALCRHLALVKLRPDVPCGEVVDLMAEVVREQGLKIRKRQGSHIIADVCVVGDYGKESSSGSLNVHQAEWSSVDMQVTLDRQDKERVLLVRFIISTAVEENGCGTGNRKSMTPSRGRRASGGGGGEGVDGERLGTRILLDALKAKLFGAGVNKRALLRSAGNDDNSTSGSSASKSLTLDPQYLNQLEDLAREDMHRTLEGTARNLEEYVVAAEEKCEQLRMLLEPMYLQYKLESPPSIAKPLPLSYYPLDLLAAYDKTKEANERISAEEKAGAVDRMACMDALKEKAWRGFLMQCDAEMTARMQRKNLQVLDRMAKCTEYQRLLIESLRDNLQRTLVPLFHNFKNQIGHDGGIYEDEDVETPLYYCRSIVGSRPATFFVTYEHLVFVSGVPGFGWSRRIRFDEILTCGLASVRLGIRKAKAIAVQAPTSVVASPIPVKRPGGASGTAAPNKTSSTSSSSSSSAPLVSNNAKEESLVFSTLIEPKRLLDLIKLLITLNDGNAKDAAPVSSALSSEAGHKEIQKEAATSLARELHAVSPFLVI